MSPEEMEKIGKMVETACEKVICQKLEPFWIERETHYKQHLFIADIMKLAETTKSTIGKAVVTMIVTALGGLVALGFVYMCVKDHIKKAVGG